MQETGHDTGSCRAVSVTPARFSQLGGGGDSEASSSGDVEIDALSEDLIELSDDRETFFRDPSGVILPADLWYPSKTFWSIVSSKVRSKLGAVA